MLQLKIKIAVLNIDDNGTVNIINGSSIEYYGSCVTPLANATLIIDKSKLTSHSSGSAAITSNANHTGKNTIKILNGSEIKNDKGMLIYQPCDGAITFENSSAEVASGIAMQAGTLNITDSKIEIKNGNRINPINAETGQAQNDGFGIFLASNSNAAYAGGIAVTINGGKFTSASVADVMELKDLDKDKAVTINGGTFSTDPSEIADVTFGDKKAAKKNSDGTYTVETFYGLTISDADAITVKRGEEKLTADSKLFKGDELTITAVEKPSYTAKIKVNDAKYADSFTVEETNVAVSVEYVANEITLDITGVSENAIITVTRGSEVLENPTTVQAGDVITIAADSDADVTLSEVTVNGEVLSAPETGYTVTGTETDAKITLVASTTANQYTVTIPDGVIVTRGDVQLDNGANVVKGDVLTISVKVPEFDDIAYGDKQPEAKALVITNSSEGAAKDVKVESDSKDFVIAGSGDSVEAGKSINTWTVQPAAGLTKGEHKAVITVTYGTDTTTTGVSITVKAGKQAAPAAVAAESTGTKSITLKKIAVNANGAEAEYSIDGKTWQNSNEFSGLTSNTKYTFYARYKATDNYDASEAVSATISTKSNPSTGGGSSSGSSGSSRPSRPSGSTSTGTSTSTTTPTINGTSKSWDDVASSINAQTSGSTDSIKLNGSNTVPAAVISAIASKDAVVTFVVDDTYSWTVDGSGMEGTASSADLSISKASVTGTDSLRGTAAVGFQVNGNVPSAKLNINLGASKAGELAHVYKRESSKLVFADNVKIDANGKASGIDVSTKGEYVVMTGKYSDRPGDVSNDGVINAFDASVLLNDIVGALAADNKLVGDFNGDGVINALDASAILKLIVSAK